jgi:CRP-like cAMP-binding protein
MRLDDFLVTNAETAAFSKGALIVRQGEEAECAYIVKKGRVAVFRAHDDGRESVMAVLGEGEIFGEMAILRFDHYTLSVRAQEDTELYVITPDLIHEQLRASHPLLRKITDTLLDRMKEVNDVLIDLDRAR